MAKARTGYPQVEPGALALANRRALACAITLSVKEGLSQAERAGAEILVIGRGNAVRRQDVTRAVSWGLGGRRMRDLTFGQTTELPTTASESAVRRALYAGARLVILRDRGRLRGVIAAEGSGIARPPMAMAHRLEHVHDRRAEARLWLLRTAGKVGEAIGVAVFAVGGVVREMLSGGVPADVDLVVEGDAAALARRLGEELRGRVAVHPAFGTASVHEGSAPDGIGLGRVDVASARREQYDAPGALPRVSDAPIEEDLLRRDFSVNAMAMTLGPASFGRLLDPCAGEGDILTRRLRVLHPLSFVEDPTRVFRAARYAARLGLALHRDSRRSLNLALDAAPYPALSGQRLLAEIEHVTAEPTRWAALSLLVAWQAFGLWDRGYRCDAVVSRRLRAARRLDRWAGTRDVDLDRIDLSLIALLMDQPPRIWRRCLARLCVTGSRLARLVPALSKGRMLAQRLAGESHEPRSRLAARLRPWSTADLAAAWLAGDRAVRRRVGWFLAEGRTVRPLLSGRRLLALGVAQGPSVGNYLERLRDLRLDGRVGTAADERAMVTQWLDDERGGAK